MRIAQTAGGAACALLLAAASGRGAPQELSGRLGIAEADLREAAGGPVVARVLDTPYGKEVAAIALMRVRATRRTFLEVVADPARFLPTHEDVVAWGRLGAPPAAAELPDSARERRVLQALETCEVGRCGMKLDAAAIERLQREVPWRSAAAQESAARVVRESLADRAASYWRGGTAGLAPIDDRPRPVDVAARAREVLARPPQLGELVPELSDHLEGFPARRSPSVRDELLWVREQFWRRQVVSLVHQAVYEPPDQPQLAVLVHRQIHASHYFEAALSVTIFLAGPDDAYVARFYRFETDHKKGAFNVIERALIRHGARRRLEKQMERLRTVLEALQVR